jgi:hypothetical protein
MSKKRNLPEALLRIAIAGVLLVGALAAYRFLAHPVIEPVLGLAKETSSLLRRVDIFVIVVLVYWGFAFSNSDQRRS